MKKTIGLFIFTLFSSLLCGEDFRFMAIFEKDDPSPLLGSRDLLDKNYLLTPWPWDKENTPFSLNSALTDIVLHQNDDPRVFPTEENLFFERLTSLWSGRLSVSFEVTEEYLSELENKDILDERADSLSDLIENKGFSDLMLDLRLSSNREDFSSLEALASSLEDSLGSSGSIIYAMKRDEAPVPPIWERSDYVMIQAYDFSGRHSTLENAEESIVNFIRRKRKEPSSLILSVPLFGRKYRSSDPDYWVKKLPYYELVDSYHPEKGTNEVDYYYFNGPGMAQQKTILAKEKELGGIALYPYEWDSRGSYSLKEAVEALLRE